MTSSKPKSVQTMKPATAAKKLGVPLTATPAEFQAGVVSRDELNEMQSTPPDWLVDLRRNGPHSKQVIAAKLKISVAGVLRGGITGPLTTAEIDALRAENPAWLEREQALQVEVRKEALRLKQR
ncbi:DUF5997 family protein [Streptosporangium vulgare]|uniref:DUF5997 family protein n=1 Tax=Streptosporangium vulgare TaxID=46190 RepID=A0ABV5TJF6_9ACTN